MRTEAKQFLVMGRRLSFRQFFLAFLMFAVCLPCVHAQTTTYTYTGNAMAPIPEPPPENENACTGCTVTGSFTVSQPLPTGFGSDGPHAAPNLVSFSFSAASVTITNQNVLVNNNVLVETDDKGMLVSWENVLRLENGGGTIFSGGPCSSPKCRDVQMSSM